MSNDILNNQIIDLVSFEDRKIEITYDFDQGLWMCISKMKSIDPMVSEIKRPLDGKIFGHIIAEAAPMKIIGFGSSPKEAVQTCLELVIAAHDDDSLDPKNEN